MRFLRNDPSLKQRRRQLRRNQTEAEKALWDRLRAGRFYSMKIFRQYSIGPYILDFYCPDLRVAIELDGGQHNQSEIRDYDKARSDYLKAHGVEVLRFWNHEVLTNREGVLKKIEEVTLAIHADSAEVLKAVHGDGNALGIAACRQESGEGE